MPLVELKSWLTALKLLDSAFCRALALNARGFAYHLLKDYQKALADFDEAIRLNPKYLNAYQNRAKTRKAAGDAEGSAADEAKVRELSKGN